MSDHLLIEVDLSEVVPRLSRAIDRLDHLDVLMADIAAVLENNVQRRFDAKTDPTGRQWDPLQPGTREAYERKYRGNIPGTLLERTREMRDSLESRAGDDWAEIGFGNQIAQYHETGTKKMARRGLLTADPDVGTLGHDDLTDIEREVTQFLGSLFG
jgi:phage virion morphogenesis protein